MNSSNITTRLVFSLAMRSSLRLRVPQQLLTSYPRPVTSRPIETPRVIERSQLATLLQILPSCVPCFKIIWLARATPLRGWTSSPSMPTNGAVIHHTQCLATVSFRGTQRTTPSRSSFPRQAVTRLLLEPLRTRLLSLAVKCRVLGLVLLSTSGSRKRTTMV